MDDTPITVGHDVQIGPHVQLLTARHPVADHRRRRERWEPCAPIVIGDNAWLAGGVIVGPGVTIGANSVVGAGRVVLRDVPGHVLVAGNPASVVRTLPDRPS